MVAEFSVPPSGRYPNFLWLYKEILPELRQHFSFHPQLVAQVERWRQEISASKSSIRRFVIMEKAPTRAFSRLKVGTGGLVSIVS